LEHLLKDLVKRNLVNDLILYEPRTFTTEEKLKMLSERANPVELGGPKKNVLVNNFLMK